MCMDSVEDSGRIEQGQSAPDRPASISTLLLLLLPVFLHSVGIALSVTRAQWFAFSGIDLLLFVGMLVYVTAVVIVARKGDLSAKLALLVYSILIPVASIEVGVFLLARMKICGLPLPPARMVSTAADTMPGISGQIRFTVNRRGVRAPDIWPESPRDRIICVGGSTTECRYVTDEKSWPWRLGDRLTEKTGRRILVANAGRSGQFSLHHLHQLRHYALADDFGTVIVLCGINDAGTLLRGNYEERAAAVPEEALVSPLREGVYYRYSFILERLNAVLRPGVPLSPKPRSHSIQQDLTGAWYAAVRRKRQRLLEANRITSVPQGIAESLDIYRENLAAIAELCKDRGQRLVLLTQPTLYHEDMSDDLVSLLWEHTDDGAYSHEVLAEVLVAYNSSLRDVCREYGVLCVDLAAVLEKDTSVFYDDCHFNISGCEKAAAVLTDVLAAELGR